MNVKGAVNCSTEMTFENGGNFTTADGIVWRLPVGQNGNFNRGGNNVNQIIQVDVNSRSGRNSFEGNGCTIPDRFNIFVDRYGRLTVPANGIEQEYLTRTNTNTSYADIRNGVIR